MRMGAKDVFANPQLVTTKVNSPVGAVRLGDNNDSVVKFNNNKSTSASMTATSTTTTTTADSVVPHPPVQRQKCTVDVPTCMDEEWHQKYAFIIGLFRKPHALLVKTSLSRERDKLTQKLNAYRLERDFVRNNSVAANLHNGAEHRAQQSLAAQMKHLDMMCVTLERQIDVLSHVDQALPTTENIYSGEPDSLDGTSSEIMMNDDLDSMGNGNESHSHNNGNGALHHGNGHLQRTQGSNFQITINGRSPLDALAMLHLERCAHRETRKELNQLQKKYEVLRDEFDSGEGLSRNTSLLFSRMNGEIEDEEEMYSNNLTNDDPGNGMSIGTEGSTSRLAEEVRLKEVTITQLRSRLLHLEKARMDKVPVDAAREIARLHSTLVQLERVRDELTLQNFTLKSKLAELSARISDSATYRLEKHNNNNNNNLNSSNHHNQKNGKPGFVRGSSPREGSSGGSADEDHQGKGSISDEFRLRRKSTYKIAHNNETNAEMKQLRGLINDLHSKELDYQKKVTTLETEMRNVKNELADETTARQESDRSVRALEDDLENTSRRLDGTEKTLLSKNEECQALKLDLDTLNNENKRLKDNLNVLHAKVEKDQTKSIEKMSKFEKEIGSILEQNRTLQEDFHKEKVLRKKYYNLVEELKGKIRVFCRIRPSTKNERINDIVAKSSDPYTVTVDTLKGQKEFQFDRVFTPEDTQEQVFSDTRNLIQSAFDGYNVCICAYGQTGSGKTYTILGDDLHPGIAPRTFSEIFSLAASMSHTYDTTVSFYVLELYNDKLIDLLNLNNNNSHNFNSSDSMDCKLEIRRDRRGTVWVSGARVLPAEDSSSLERSFRQALSSRHTACTRMNDRSSRSHLIVGLMIETVSKVNGSVLRGKISLVDLAGSERTGKSGVTADTLREANSINKSLSAFGDVVNALTTDQSFVPYRNNKLTLLMQDSIGGNAKTLMFVNISPSSYNLDESVVSLSYATRVKQVTNGATRNAESKEISRLRSIISRLKRGENVSVDVDDM